MHLFGKARGAKTRSPLKMPDQKQTISFLREKTRLCAALFDGAHALIDHHEWLLQEILGCDDFDQQANFIDRKLDTFIRGRGGKKGVTSTRATLKEKFGFFSLGGTSEAIAKKSLKRGKIATLEEAQIIHDFLADVDRSDEFGERRSQKLERLLWQFNERNNPRPS